jgi:two-component system chemotaxis sensor kinase CheA
MAIDSQLPPQDQSPSLAGIAAQLAGCDPNDTMTLAEIRNLLGAALEEPPLCDRPAQHGLAERGLRLVDTALTGTAKSPAEAINAAVKLLHAASDVGDKPKKKKSKAPQSSARQKSNAPSMKPSSQSSAAKPTEEDFSFDSSPPAAAPPPPSVVLPAPNPQIVSAAPAVRMSAPAPAVRMSTPAAPPPSAPAQKPPPPVAIVSPPPSAPKESVVEEEETPAESDPELIREFVGEADQYLTDAEGALLRLESNPEDSEAIGTVFRAFHTIKGVSAFLGLGPVSKLAHKAESLLSRMRDGEIRCSGGYASLALASVDALKALVRVVASGEVPKTTGAIDDLGERLMAPEAHGISAEGGAAAVKTEALDGGDGPQAAQQPVQAQTSESKAQESSIRVRTDRLDRLIDMVGELVIAQSMVSQDGLLIAGAHHGLLKKIAHAAKIIRELQDLSMSLRMVPLKPTFQKVARVVRDVARKNGRVVQFYTEGDDTEIDRNMVDVIADPLVHMARNAVDHGVEMPDDRVRKGKPAQGTIRLAALRSGGEVVLELRDDGQGIARDRVAKKAVERGLIASDVGMTDGDVLNLIFEPGFSTREEVTDISGRGVGMDVVKRGVEALKGRIDIASTPGEGTTFSLRLPLTLAITDGMLVRVGTERYVIPAVSIRMSLRPDREALSTVSDRGEFLRLRGELVPVYRMHHLFDVPNAQEDPSQALLVVVNDGSGSAALLVDELLGQQQVVTKSLGGNWGQLPGIAGGAILGDGRVGLILDPVGIAALARQRSSYSRPRMPAFDMSAFDAA